jgi:PQQ-like domain
MDLIRHSILPATADGSSESARSTRLGCLAARSGRAPLTHGVNLARAATLTAGLLVALVGATPAATAQGGAAAGPGAGYHLVKSIALGGDGGWDYLTFDGAARKLYISRSTRVLVLDAETGKVSGEIPNLSGVHGIAIAQDAGRGFISNGRSDMVTIFDLKTGKVLSEVKSTGQNPDAIIYDPASHRAFAFNGRSGSATAIDAATGKVAGTIALGGKPEFAASDLRGSVFVNVEDKNEVVAIDSKNLTATHHWPLAGCDEPSAMAIDAAHQRLVIGCGNQTALIVDSTSGRVVTKLPICKGVDAAGFDPGAGLAFASCGDGTLTVAHEDSPDSWKVVASAATKQGARTMALDEKTHQVYLVTAQFGPRPAPTAAEPHPRPPMVPGTFEVLVVSP